MAPQRAMDATGARYLSSARRGRQIDRQTPRQHFKNAPPNSPKRQLLFLHLAQWANTDRSRNHPCPRSPPPPISPACLFCAMHLSCGDTSYSRADGGVTLLSIGRPRAGITPDITHHPHARQHASAGGGRATPAAAVHHDGREDALRGQRAVPRGTARAAAPARGSRPLWRRRTRWRCESCIVRRS
jgi:hypothetical protein